MDCSQEESWLDGLAVAHLRSGGVILIPRDEVLGAIKKGAAVGARVVGLDAFILHPDGKVQPDMASNLDPVDGDEVEVDQVCRHLQQVSAAITHFEVSWEAPNKPMQTDAPSARR